MAESTDAPTFNGDREAFTDALFAWMTAVGGRRYNETVTQLEHGLQVANCAVEDGAPDAEVLAGLLHDVGHLLMHEQRKAGLGDNRDLRHERVGAAWLARVLPDPVVDPVRLHVPAKRYLCAVDETYWDTLSVGSRRSLELQGGAMSDEEVSAFEALPGWEAGVALRRRDEAGKCAGKPVPGLASYRNLLVAHLRPSVEA